MRAYLALGAALCLLGCAELRWDKPGAEAEAVTKDLESCRSQARATLARTATVAPPVSIDPKFGSVSSQPSVAGRAIEEQEAADRCMRGKGYHLVPVQQ